MRRGELPEDDNVSIAFGCGKAAVAPSHPLATRAVARDVPRMAAGPSDISPRDIPPCGCAERGAANASTCYCGVEDLLRIIRRRYSLAVMNVIHGRGAARYHDIAASMSAMSSSTLAETLHALVAARLLERRETDERPHATYALTESGEKLLSRLRQLLSELDLS
jgi:DNA-binding HxlR family transcriptional regulator